MSFSTGLKSTRHLSIPTFYSALLWKLSMYNWNQPPAFPSLWPELCGRKICSKSVYVERNSCFINWLIDYVFYWLMQIGEEQILQC